ncbi:hypothetical protein LJC14_07460, partial [Treponema sp. OttesenSCG-928-L16]|nr:hypothetical protein [Treponema sp. OttesenSCG-928-L16]
DAAFDRDVHRFGKLAGKEITPTKDGIDMIRSHLKNLDSSPVNDFMISQIEEALKNGSSLRGPYSSFYMHELSESMFMRNGFSYNSAHNMALQKYSVSPYSVYSPQAIQTYPQYFNKNWLNFWGIGGKN